ncbi:hypothetical protein [Endozoicomonas sp. 8E]|uniref:hypothetical protein n=1 Tax=Endozoicomonas sp. 8E TaxID=3035692 RepID=UPI002939095C|nr:hypothetical protein [Endozoicomonas sp. 8E]WOG29040.1 hypothetical protein P6910_05085 [Endozoicomonas sp. 8E]
MYENMWLTDNVTAYENCEIPENPSKVSDHFICDSPTQLVFLGLLFLDFAAGVNDRTFDGGKEYYLLSTSTGAQSSVHNKKGGHCLTHNMRLKIYICKKNNINETNPDCNEPDPQLNWYSPTGVFTYAPFKNPLRRPLTTLSTPPLTHPLTIGAPDIINDTDSYTDNEAETIMTNATGTLPTILTDIGNDTKAAIKTTEKVPDRYDESPAQPFQLIWVIGYNQTRTAQIFAEEHYPVVALCKEPNTRISLLKGDGTIVDSWLCQKIGERLTILKPEYRNGDVYLFEARPQFSRVRVWKSKLSVNVGSFRHHIVNNVNPLHHSPTLALLISMYFIAASTF